MRFALTMIILMTLTPMASAADINWRVSVKFILNAGGNRSASGVINTDQEVQDQIDLANAILDATGRGYGMQLTEIVDLAGVSQWFNADVDGTTRDNLQAAALGDPATYAWRTNAINIYVLGSGGSGICSFPGDGNEIIVVGQGARATTFLHESGHYMDLCHTQGCPCGSCSAGDTGQCNTTPGDDDISDTLPDLSCWDQDDIAQWSFSMNYGGLTPGQQTQVDRVFFNVMSYHGTRNRFSSNQLDHATDTSNVTRNAVATGRTWFVDDDASILALGTSVFPYETVAQGVAAAASSDIVLVRVGSYPETMTLTNRMCFRATRGNAVIGSGAAAFLSEPGDEPIRRIYPETYDGMTGP